MKEGDASVAARGQGAGEVRSGRIEMALIRWLMRGSTVAAVEPLSPHFRLIDLEGEALRGVAWAPGQKMQVMIGGLRTTRTYTPMLWDGDRGATRILAWSHGSGPGSEWATSLAQGDACRFFGPRRSLDVGELHGPVALFGDETAFGLAAALQAHGSAASLHALFEVSSVEECRPIADHIGLRAELLMQRSADEAHLAEIEDRLAVLAREDATVILAGRAPAIQRVSRTLKAAGVGASRLRTKAYWAPGKAGLD